jgi:hypothetical protein
MKRLLVAVAALVVASVPSLAQDGDALYYHSYSPALNGNFQLQPGQGFSIVEPFAGFVRMVQVCVRDAKSTGPMPTPTPMLATRTTRGAEAVTGAISVASCAILEGESIAIGLADGAVDADTSDENSRKQLAYMSGSYTVIGYYSKTRPITRAPAILPN